jgi:hypothetical protein
VCLKPPTREVFLCLKGGDFMQKYENGSALGRIFEIKKAKREDVVFSAPRVQEARARLAEFNNKAEMPITRAYVEAYDKLPALTRESVESFDGTKYELVISHKTGIPGMRKPEAGKK